MAHRIQYHNPNAMGYGVENSETKPFGVLTSKEIINYEGDIIWLVGKTEAKDSRVYLRCCFIADDLKASKNPKLPFRYTGRKGVAFDPLIVIDDTNWYEELLRITGAYEFGFTELTSTKVIQGLKSSALEAGYRLPF